MDHSPGATTELTFLQGGGELGAQMRAKDWSKSPLGPPATWPQSLRSVVGLLLSSKFPMFVAWGRELGFLYNDPYADILGAKHPSALGARFQDIWSEIWTDISPLIDTAMAGQATYHEDLPLVMNRKGFDEETWFTFSYSPVRDEKGAVAGIFCVVAETTAKVISERRNLAETERLKQLFAQAPGFMAMMRGPEHVFELVNPAYLQLIGHRDVIGKPARQALPEVEGQGFFELLDGVYANGKAFKGTALTVYLQRTPDGPREERYVDLVYQPVTDTEGRVVGIFAEGSDVTERVQAEEALRESAAHYRNAAELNPQVAWTATRDGQLDRVAERWRTWTGSSGLGDSWGEGLHPDDLPATIEAWSRSVRTGVPYDIEHRVKLLSGEHRWARSRASARRDAEGRILRWYGTTEDIHEQKVAEDRLRDSMDRLASERHALEVLNSTGAKVAAELDLDQLVQTVVDAGVDLTGAQFGAFFYNVLDQQGARYMLYALSGAERSAFADFGMPRATSVFAPTFRGEGVIRSGDILRDERYGHNAPHHGMPVGHLPVRSYLAVPVTSRSGEVLGGLFFGHEEPEMFSERSERLMLGLAGQAAISIDNARLFQAAQRAKETLEQRVEERTRERNRVWALSHDLLAVATFDGCLKAINPAWSRLLGFDEETLLSQPFTDLIHPDDLEAAGAIVGAMMSGEVAQNFEDRLRTADGSYRWIAWTAVPEGEVFYAVGRDVTAEKEAAAELELAQEQLRQAQKMEAVGQLTGGIAHDFNNLLAGIVGALDLMQTRMAQGRTDSIERYAKAAMSSAQRAAALTHRLLAFSRRQPLDPKPVSANQLVTSMEDLLRRTIGPLHALEIVTAGGLWTALCDPNQLESAILNLAINARDAMPEGGKLTIETCNTHLDDAYVAAQRDVTPGQYVCICITDTGTGMPRAVIERAFEPFFTTKPLGQGTGLGLSMVYGFTKQSEGHLKIYSEEGKGTTVKIYLPRHRGAAPDDTLVPTTGEAPRAASGETVLVVEDEPVIRDLIVELLQDLGYRALEAADGPAGLAVLKSRERIDLLVTDVGLPGLNGRQLADQARERRPDLKVLFITGYAENATLANGFLDPGMEMITKPFAVEALATKIRAMIPTG